MKDDEDDEDDHPSLGLPNRGLGATPGGCLGPRDVADLPTSRTLNMFRFPMFLHPVGPLSPLTCRTHKNEFVGESTSALSTQNLTATLCTNALLLCCSRTVSLQLSFLTFLMFCVLRALFVFLPTTTATFIIRATTVLSLRTY